MKTTTPLPSGLMVEASAMFVPGAGAFLIV
jgi:hypothetical protein